MIFWNIILCTFIFINYTYSVTWALFWFILGMVLLLLNLSTFTIIYIILLYLGGIFILFTYVSLFRQKKKIRYSLIWLWVCIGFVTFPNFFSIRFLNLNFLKSSFVYSILFILIILLLLLSYMFDTPKRLRVF